MLPINKIFESENVYQEMKMKKHVSFAQKCTWIKFSVDCKVKKGW